MSCSLMAISRLPVAEARPGELRSSMSSGMELTPIFTARRRLLHSLRKLSTAQPS